MKYEMVIGLETHIELSTKTKIFCSCTTAFGADANTHCCPVCVGLPGALPKLNKRVVEFAVKAGIATNCEISNISKMDRKNYVYPDLAKAYQISQSFYPLCRNGHIELSGGKKIRINRIHIEEDAGKLIYHGKDTLIDYNRSGVPLIEIVSEPDFRSTDQVREYLEKLRLIMKYIGVSDCKMQEGSMRCDINISIREKGEEKLSVRTEIKNVNSISFVIKAIDAEFKRQVAILERGEEIRQETLRYSDISNSVEVMRQKEDSQEYRYFRDPDLLSVYVSNEEIKEIFKDICELPDSKIKRYVSDFNLSLSDAKNIVKYPKIAEYFEEISALSNAPKLCANIILMHIFRFFNGEEEKENAKINIAPKNIARVAQLINTGEISGSFLKKIIDKMFETNKTFDELFTVDEFKQLDSSVIEDIVNTVLKNNSKAVDDYMSGKDKAIGILIGRVMRETNGKADAKEVEEMIKKKIGEMERE